MWKLVVTSPYELPDSHKQNIHDLAVKILEAQAESKITMLSFAELSSVEEGQIDKQMINGIVRSGLIKLTYLNLSNTNQWWSNEEALGHLCGFLKEQTALAKLHLRDNKFSQIATEQVFSALIESSCIAKMKLLDLNGSCNFDTDESCTLMA